MKTLYNELSAVSGFIGICLYHAKTGIVAEATPGNYTQSHLAGIGQRSIEAYRSGNSHFGPIHDAILYENNHLILIQKLTDEAFVYILAEPDTNVSLLRIALGLINEALLRQSESPAPS